MLSKEQLKLANQLTEKLTEIDYVLRGMDQKEWQISPGLVRIYRDTNGSRVAQLADEASWLHDHMREVEALLKKTLHKALSVEKENVTAELQKLVY